MEITIKEIKDNVVWMVFIDDDGREIWKQPLAHGLREHLKPERELDKLRGDNWNTEQAFRKLKIHDALKSELLRA